MKKKTERCDCISPDPITGKPLESYQTTQPRSVIYPFTGELVEIDECIADTMVFLWAHGIETASCCCSHNKPHHYPMCIVRNPFADEKEYNRVRRVIKKSGDKRHWGLLSAPARPPYLLKKVE